LARIANACRAYGLRPIDGPFTDYGNAVAYRASAIRSRALGFEGKWAIHPSQIEIANAVYSPAADQVNWARRIVDALEASNREGRGAVGVDNILVDMAHYKVASRIITRAKVIAAKAQAGGAGV
jgi:malyl-CoA/(S)-citramalyl-CoA lyase